MVDNQNNFKTLQNFDIDINKVYSDFIGAIDSFRSNVNITDPSNQQLFTKFTADSFNGTPTTKGLKLEKTPQESRCHAFYRLLGLPVISKDNTFYNPGIDPLVQPNKKITIQNKVDIANNQLVGFTGLSDFREAYINNLFRIFSNNQTIDARVLGISGINVRSFASPFLRDASAFGLLIYDQSYDTIKNSLVGFDSNVKFSDYVDASNNKPSSELLGTISNRSHIIKPFIVDPRIDLSTSTEKRAAVPFLQQTFKLKVTENTPAKPLYSPLIEKIIIERFVLNAALGKDTGFLEKSIQQIQSIDSIKNEQIIKDISNNKNYKLVEQQQFIKFFNISRAMVTLLVKSQQDIKKTQSKYYWLPVPSINGPEGGSTTPPIFVNLPQQFLTDADGSLIISYLKKLFAQANAQIANILVGGANGVSDAGNYLLSSYTFSFNNDTSSAFGNISSVDEQKLLKSRESAYSIANTALRNIEIIMGEFSGFGLCDIIAIMAGLYIMPLDNLLGFLDDDAYDRAKKTIKLPEVRPSSVNDAITQLSKSVQDMYNLMDKIYNDVSIKNITT